MEFTSETIEHPAKESSAPGEKRRVELLQQMKLLYEVEEDAAQFASEGMQRNDESRTLMLRKLVDTMKRHVLNAQLCDELYCNIRVLVGGMTHRHADEVHILDKAYRQMFLSLYHKFVRESHDPKVYYLLETWSGEKYNIRNTARKLASMGIDMAASMLHKRGRPVADLLRMQLHHFMARRYCELAVICMTYKNKMRWRSMISRFEAHQRAALDLSLEVETSTSRRLSLAHTSAFVQGFLSGRVAAAQKWWNSLIHHAQNELLTVGCSDERDELKRILDEATDDLRHHEEFVLKYATSQYPGNVKRTLWMSPEGLDSWTLMTRVDCQHWPFFRPPSPDCRRLSPSTSEAQSDFLGGSSS